MNGFQHYAEGLRLLQLAQSDAEQGNDHLIAGQAALASAHFLAASAAKAIAGSGYTDPMQVIRSAREVVEAKRKREDSRSQPLETACLLAPTGCDDCQAEAGEEHRHGSCPGNQRAKLAAKLREVRHDAAGT